MLRYIALGVVMTAIFVGIQLYRAGHVSVVSLEDNDRHPPMTSQLTANHFETNLTANLSANSKPRDSRHSNQTHTPPRGDTDLDRYTFGKADNDVIANSASSAWEEDASSPNPPSRFANKGIDARALKIKREQLSRATPGSELSLPIPQTGQDYKMSVTEVGRHQNGDKTLKGYLVENPQYAVVMTQGERSTFATVNTPDGSFLLEAKADQGWMLATNDLNHLVDPNLVDYMIPEISR